MGYLDYWRWYFWLVDKSTEEKERRQMKNLITILILFVATGCLREVETEGGGVKSEPSGNELPPRPPPPVTPTNEKPPN